MIGRRRLALGALLLLGLGYASLIQSFSWNQTSHYDLIRALNRDSTQIDAYANNTGDKVAYHDHIYSARAPGLALYSLPFYDALNAVDASSWARSSPAQRGDDEMIWLIGLWGNVLPGLVLLLLVRWAAERLAPGFGTPAAVAMGLGTLALPLSTLLFSHIFAACLGFGAFALLMRERDGPESLSLIGLAGALLGYAITSEYPLAFAAVVLGLYCLSRADTRNPLGLSRRAVVMVAGALVGIVPLLLYNHYAFHSWTHLAYSDVPRQQKGFFGINAPSLPVLATLLLDSRGLLTLSPMLVAAGVGTWLIFRSGRRAEALTIAGIVLFYVVYNSGYYLPFGGGFMGPRFLATMVPFLALGLAPALRRYPGPTIALAGVSVFSTVLATATHPLVGYETETAVWTRLLDAGSFQPTIASAYGLGRGWGGIWPFLLAVVGAIGLAAWAGERFALTWASLGAGVLALAVWLVFALLGPRVLGLDHRGLVDILRAGDRTALSKPFPTNPLDPLAWYAAGAGLFALVAARLLRHQAPTPARRARTRPRLTAPALR